MEKKIDKKVNSQLLLDQYRIYVEHITNFANRRDSMNQFYLSIISAIFGVLMLLFQQNAIKTELEYSIFALMSIFGIILCFTWNQNIKAYRNLSKIKLELINKLEEKLPFQFFGQEKEIINKSKNKGLTQWEVKIPVTIGLIFALITVYSIILMF